MKRLKKPPYRKRDGFLGEDAIVLPKMVIQQCESTPLVNSLFITDIGYYPKAEYHYRERRHGINQNILIYCVDGKGQATIEGKKFMIHATNYLIIPAGKKHFYQSESVFPWTIYWIHFGGSNASVISEILYKRMLADNNTIIPSDQLLAIFRRMYNSLQMGYSTDNMIYSSLSLSNFLTSFLYPDKNNETTEKDTKNFDKAIHFLKENIHRSLTLNEIASVVNISPSHFSNKFKEITGYSPIAYFNHLKLQKACQLLRFSQLRISEIAHEVGFDDPYYFSRLFSLNMGVSPKEFRNSKLMTKSSL
jgi:AraC family transcriptional regulator of arabinose operon